MGRFLLRRTAQAVFVLLTITFLVMVGLTELGDPFVQIGQHAQTPRVRRPDTDRAAAGHRRGQAQALLRRPGEWWWRAGR